MPARLTLVTPPALEPVTLAEAKLFARIEHTADDTLVTDLVGAARKRCEQRQGTTYITQTWDLFLDAFPCLQDGRYEAFSIYNLTDAAITLPLHPVQSITSITYTLADGTPLVIASSDYAMDVASLPARIVPQTGFFWPRDLLKAVNGVAVRFLAGYGSAAVDVPEYIRLAIKQLVAFWYVNRDAMPDIPPEIDSLLSEATGGFAYA